MQYKVTGTIVCNFTAVVEADSEAEAEDKAYIMIENPAEGGDKDYFKVGKKTDKGEVINIKPLENNG